MHNGYNKDYWIDIYSLNKTNRFMTQAKKEGNHFFFGFMIYCEFKNNKGESKTIDCSESDLKEYYPEFYSTL